MASTTSTLDQPSVRCQPTAGRASRWPGVLLASLVVYALAVVVLWLGMYLGGDRWLLPTLFLFGPRWLCALPLLVLLPAAAIWRRRWLWLPAITAVLVMGPILGFEVHLADSSGTVALRVMTCNVQQLHIDDALLAELIDRDRPDIVALQEVHGKRRRIEALRWPPDWKVVWIGEYLLASRYPIVAHEGIPRRFTPNKLSGVRYTVQLPDREVQLFNLHLISPRFGLEAVLDREKGIDVSKTPSFEAMLEMRAEEARYVSRRIAEFAGPKIVVGDFNTPIESPLFRHNWSWLGNAFSTAGFGFGFTKITEKQGWSYGTRIDHILYTPPWQCVRAWVGPDVGADHLPLVAEFD